MVWGRKRTDRAGLDGVDVGVEPGEGAPGPDHGGGPAPLAAGDPVPLFRADLRVARSASPGLVEVGEPQGGRTFTLYEFELGVARLLDGRRPASEVIATGSRLGIPIDLRGLNEFVRQMWRYGFLAPPGAPPARGGEAGTWAKREEWDEATRTLFQTGVRLLRSGRGEDAAGYFEAVLDAHPGNAEAAEMLALVASGRPLAASPIGARPASAGAARPARRRLVAAAVALTALGAGLAGVAVLRLPRGARPPPPAPAAAPGPAGAAPPSGAAAPPREVPAAAPAAWRSTPVATRRRAPLADVVAPGSGSVTWRRRSSGPVRQGERIAEVRVPTGRAAASPELARRIAELERLAAQDPVYRDFLERARREQRRAARGRSRRLAVLAPAAGLLTLLPEPPRRAAEGEVVGWIVDPSTWHLGVVLAGDPPPLDAECEVFGDDPSERARCRLRDVAAADGGEVVATAEVLEAEAPWIARAQAPQVRLAPPGTERKVP